MSLRIKHVLFTSRILPRVNAFVSGALFDAANIEVFLLLMFDMYEFDMFIGGGNDLD